MTEEFLMGALAGATLATLVCWHLHCRFVAGVRNALQDYARSLEQVDA